ncbi:MAG: aromatic amino acid ammonia-lyase [Myxococcales bacterium]|nr:aromatic amino acid ammonia-lyase [Myxococcales bacterium]MDH5565296.1 aromatic amino acid ammonia-lyase [Myxococcales bacterium]
MIGLRSFAVPDVLAMARGEVRVELCDDPAYRARLARGRTAVERAQQIGDTVYGVTTGVGASSHVVIPLELREDLAANLMRFHGCGTGRALSELESAAVVAVRLVSLARGYSGVRETLLQRLCDLLNARLLPRIPEEGSVGASGDLTPLSYLAALLAGEREATLRGRELTAAQGLAEIGVEALALAPKESLALMNGTAVMTAIACVTWERAARLARLAAAITSIVVDVTRGNRGHFDARIFELKPHPGQQRCAEWIRADLELDPGSEAPAAARLQDRYSLRCAPHVIGVLVDALEEARRILDVEINSVNDNPLVDPDTGDVLHGGNFYGGHVCFAMDGLKASLASVADLLDRQLALLCVPETSAGLSPNLVAASSPSHHGFKAMQISASALTAEALKLTMPAAAFSRSTESHNQDKVSMGTIAARDCRRVVELTETVGSIALLAACQALDLRDGGSGARRARALHEAVRKAAPMVAEDRRLDGDIARVLEMLRGDALPLGSYSSAR